MFPSHPPLRQLVNVNKTKTPTRMTDRLANEEEGGVEAVAIVPMTPADVVRVPGVGVPRTLPVRSIRTDPR